MKSVMHEIFGLRSILLFFKNLLNKKNANFELLNFIRKNCQTSQGPLSSELELPSELAVAFAHNFVEIWNTKDNCCVYSVQCEERCILFSARFFGDYRNDLVLASGTVFNQVLLWKIISKNEYRDEQKQRHVDQSVGVIDKRLIGHEVYFNIYI